MSNNLLSSIGKWIRFFLVVVLTIYPVAELNRLIILAWQEYGLIKPWWFELMLINCGYLIAMVLIARFLK